jgi:hypothetical protein
MLRCKFTPVTIRIEEAIFLRNLTIAFIIQFQLLTYLIYTATSRHFKN